MIKTRRAELRVKYNSGNLVWEVKGEVKEYVEEMTYTDVASDNSDSLELTLDATDDKWMSDEWMPDKGATLKAQIVGYDWDREGDKHKMECGLFVLDDISYSDAPTTLRVGGASKPADTDFSELERDIIHKNTSVKRIGKKIAKRYGLQYTYDAEDYDIDCDEQDTTDSSYFNSLCQRYGLILKVYAKRMWVYDREAYKEKKAVKKIDRFDMEPGSFSWSTALYGKFTGGYFNYTDPDKNIDIVCEVGKVYSENHSADEAKPYIHTKNVSRRATSVYDASVQLCAEINNANHGLIKASFRMPGEWDVSAANCIELTGFGDGKEINGKYFVDQVTHAVAANGGFTSTIECSKVQEAFHHWDVGGKIITYPDKDGTKQEYDNEGKNTGYTSSHAMTSPAANAESKAKGVKVGDSVTLSNAPFYFTSVAPSPSCTKSGTFYFYDGVLLNGRYRITNSAARCGKLPVGKNVTGWVPASYCT